MGMPGSGHSLWPNAGSKKLQADTDDEEDIGDQTLTEREREIDTGGMLLRSMRPVLNGPSQATFCS